MQGLLEFIDLEGLTTMVIAFLPKLVAAILVLVAFWILMRVTRPAISRVLRRADFQDALVGLLVDNVYRFAIMAIGIVMAASQLGIDVGAALAGLGVAGVAVGFAAQDSLANSIAGFLIFWDKPFKVGDYITTQDRYGKVHNITLRTTRIRTPENAYVVIPNREIIEQPMVNHSLNGDVRVDVGVGIAYKEDIAKARDVLLSATGEIEGLLEDPAPAVVVKELADSSVNLELRVWIGDASRERPVTWAALETAKTALDDAGIEIPFPHMQLFVEDVEEPVWDKVGSIMPKLEAHPA